MERESEPRGEPACSGLQLPLAGNVVPLAGKVVCIQGGGDGHSKENSEGAKRMGTEDGK